MITTVTLNTAIDKAYVIDHMQQGEVMRVLKCSNTPGGKGLNVAKVASACGADTVATGFVGGHAGAHIEEMLDAQGIKHDFVHASGETRCCINVIASDGSSTEFLEPGEAVSAEETARLMDKFDELAAASDVITISGSAPKGMPENIYAELISKAKAAGKKVILDTSGKLLKESIKALPTMIKPNKDEVEDLLDIKVEQHEDLVAGARKIHEMGIPIVVVSLGAQGAMVVSDEGEYICHPPKIKVVNTVGCGDSMTAAFAVGLERGMSIRETLKYATAVSAANAMTMATGSVEIADVEENLKHITVQDGTEL